MGIIVKQGEKGQVSKFIKALLYGFQYLNNVYYSYINTKLEELKFNGQLINLQHRLNNSFGSDILFLSGKIYISNVSTVNLTWIFRYTESNPVYVDRYTEESEIFIKRYSEVVQATDFIVYVPASWSINEVKLAAMIDRYKLADKTYQIILYSNE